MNLEAQISRINNPQLFVDMCNTILTEKYGDDYQIVDGTRSDEGDDGYIRSEERLFAIYCPIKRRTDQEYKEKIANDLNKAHDLSRSNRLPVKRWTFITPGKLSHDVLVYLKNKSEEYGLIANHQEATMLANEFFRHEHLIKKFPDLHMLNIDAKLDKILQEFEKQKQAPSPTGRAFLKLVERQNESVDLKRVLDIIKSEQAETSKKELRSIFYSTADDYARVNAVLGLIKWYDPLDDKPDDIIDFCEQGMIISERIKDESLRALFLANKASFLSAVFSKLDTETAFSIEAGNVIGLPIITEDYRQRMIKRLREIEDAYNAAFSAALDIAGKTHNPMLLGRILLQIGNAAGERFIHLNHFRLERAEREKVLSKRALTAAKDLFLAVGDELSVGYALHNLALQLKTFGDRDAALSLVEKARLIAEKYADVSLKQTTGWLIDTLTTGKMPNYVAGERRERKK